MSQPSFSGHGQSGDEPRPEPGTGSETGDMSGTPNGNGIPGTNGIHDAANGPRHDGPGDDWDRDAELDRLIADVDAGRIQVPPAEPIVQGLTVNLAEISAPDTADLAGLNVTGFTQGGPADTMAPGAALTALAEAACAPAALPGLNDNQVLGLAAAGKRIAALGTWIELTAASQFAARRRTGDTPGTVAGEILTEFAGDELAPELGMTPFAAAQHLGYARDVARRLPATFAELHAGRVDGYRVKIVAEATQWLSDEDAAEADRVLAVSAAQLTYGRLRNAAARLVLMLDPETARRRKDAAASNARVTCFREEAGTAGLSGRDLPSAGTLASWAHVKARAAAYRAAGMAGTIEALRAKAFLDLLQELDSRDGLDQGTPDSAQASDPRGTDGGQAPMAALINITVTDATLAGTSEAPGEVAGFGLMDAESVRDLVTIASAHPRTRWCVTVIGADGTAAAHGCAPGRHSYHPTRNRDGPPEPDSSQRAAEFLCRLKVELAPIAKGTCDHSSYEPGYRPSRKLKHLIKARTARCHFRGCSHPAADCDADHTVPWPAGPTCQCNLGPPCRHHHRCKQDPGWTLTQPEPGVMVWRNPAGRTHTTTPTVYPI